MTLIADTSADKWKTSDRTAADRKWGSQWQTFTSFATQALVHALQPRPGMRVLDLACGSGDPAIFIASAVLPGGHVTAIDMSADILQLGADKARAAGLANLSFEQADAQSLPFSDGSFDAVTCRFGVMFFPDCVAALRQALRVLRPAGRIVLVAWGPYSQGYFQHTIGFLRAHAGLSDEILEADVPQAYRFSRPERLAAKLNEAGFVDVQSEFRHGDAVWPGDAVSLWQHFLDTSQTFRPYFLRLSEPQQKKMAAEVMRQVSAHFDGAVIRLKGTIVLATGIRP
jgi:ubiquinone/menaquinone biosynthesis C-methylase UbiE